jgi:hypothetical protein
VIAVHDGQRDGRAERLAAAHTTDDLDAIGLDLHPAAPAVATLPPREIRVDVLGEERETRRDALDHRGEARPVGLAGGHPAQPRHGLVR